MSRSKVTSNSIGQDRFSCLARVSLLSPGPGGPGRRVGSLWRGGEPKSGEIDSVRGKGLFQGSQKGGRGW